ncbi:MAG: MBL fold metallo-hydrolase [Nitrospinota bacterium]|nr:MBL fold metallo-hydrolase [Nitrospinota bacterium]
MEIIDNGSGLKFEKHSITTPYHVGVVHIYTCEINGNLILFDTGPPTITGREYLKKNIDMKRLKYLFITHCHPDHFGQMKFIEQSSDATIIVSKYDSYKYESPFKHLFLFYSFFRQLGFPLFLHILSNAGLTSFFFSGKFSNKYKLLEESGEILDSLGIRYVRCPGHSQSDIIYLLNGYAISGDVILREIFTAPLLDTDYESFSGRFRNYDAYCSTISKLKNIEKMTFLPSHRDYIDSVDNRIIYFVEKLLSRAETAAPILKANDSIYQAAEILFPLTKKLSFIFFIKVSELVFIDDFIKNPNLLAEALKKNGLFEVVENKFRQFLNL